MNLSIERASRRPSFDLMAGFPWAARHVNDGGDHSDARGVVRSGHISKAEWPQPKDTRMICREIEVTADLQFRWGCFNFHQAAKTRS